MRSQARKLNCGRKFVLLGVSLGWQIGLLTAPAAEGAAGDSPPPLHVRIDALIDQSAGGASAEPATDAEFHRRVMLDLAGRIPTAEETRAFLADDAPDKRERLIDHGLASPAFARRMRDVLNVMLMERLGEHDEWLAFLESSIRERRGWDAIARAILDPHADDPETRGAAFFWTKRLENYGQNPVDYPALTRDVGRLFLGVDLQCAQCHNHLFVKSYTQLDYQGLAAFVGQTFIRKDVPFPAVGQNLVKGPVEFTSVLTAESGVTGPRLPGGTAVEIPSFPKGEEYELPPDKKSQFPGQPKFRPLAILAEQVARPDNAAFVRNSVNRFWFLLFGRGLVHPLDLHHPDNPPSHPELLALLADEFAAHHCEIRWLFGELMRTRAYQRSSRYDGALDGVGEASYRVALERPLSAEQFLDSLLLAVGHRSLAAAVVAGPADGTVQKEYDRQRVRFRGALANVPRDPEVEFRPSVVGALFLMHDAAVQRWFDPEAEGGTVARLCALPDERVADELYLTVLSRLPSDAEREAIATILREEPDRRARTMSQLVWGLVASAEFALNH